MSTAAVSPTSIYQELQAYFQQRHDDVRQLGQDLTSGNLAAAQQDFSTLQALGQSGPSANGDVFQSSQREQDLNAIGQALQSGNLSAAQQAFAQLEGTYQQNGSSGSASSSSGASDSGSIYQQIQAFEQQRSADLQQLGQDLSAGNLTNALQDYTALQTLGETGPFKSGNTFHNSQREQDLNAIGQALQSGDLAGAQAAFAQLESTYNQGGNSTPSVAAATSASGQSSTSGPELVLNLAGAPAGEQITINLTNEGNGTEQVSVSAANPQNQTPEQINLSLNLNSNQQIVLNLFNTLSNQTQGSNLNTSA